MMQNRRRNRWSEEFSRLWSEHQQLERACAQYFVGQTDFNLVLTSLRVDANTLGSIRRVTI